MSTEIDFEIMELLTSKICHDLISPIGAINNGMELIEELGMDAGEEALELIGYSAAQSSAKLQAYRMAYGAGGGDSSIKPEDVHKSIEAIVGAEKKITQEWDPYAPIGPDERPEGFAKVLTCALLLCMDCLPKGGTLSVSVTENGSILVTAAGTDCSTRNDMESCLNLSFEKSKLEPKHIHAYVTGLIAKHYDHDIQPYGEAENTVSFAIAPPAD